MLIEPETKTKVNGLFFMSQQALNILTVTINHKEGDKDKGHAVDFIRLSQEEVESGQAIRKHGWEANSTG